MTKLIGDDVQVVGSLSREAGSTGLGGDAAVGGVLFVSTVAAGNVGSGEDDLATYSIPANTLATNGQSIWFEAGGALGGNSNTKTVRVRFGSGGSTLVFDSGNIGSVADPFWTIRGRIYRTGAATQICASMGGSKGTLFKTVTATTTHTLSGAATIKVTGEAVSTDDITISSFIVGFDDNNT